MLPIALIYPEDQYSLIAFRMSYSRPRFIFIFLLLLTLIFSVVLRLIYLGHIKHDPLANRADQTYSTTRFIPATRGAFLDRHEQALAISAPLEDIIINPKQLLEDASGLTLLDEIAEFGIDVKTLKKKIKTRPESQYLVAKKDLPPVISRTIQAKEIPGVYIERQYHTFYPSGELFAQLLGFTDHHNQGQDGLELAFESLLKPLPGKERVHKNAIGQILSIQDNVQSAQPGQTITLSIDSRIQAIAFDAVKAMVIKTKAKNGEVVVLNPSSGEVLAITSYPSFNPNRGEDRTGKEVRLAPATDIYEPGSVMKTFAITAALERAAASPDEVIPIYHGKIQVGSHTVRDEFDHGDLTVTQVLKYSSNVGTSTVLRRVNKEEYGQFLQTLGFGSLPTSIFPGEAPGKLPDFTHLDDFSYATVSFGYAMTASLLQLARAYSIFANDGVLLPLSFTKLDQAPKGERVISAATASAMKKILKEASAVDGSGRMAMIPGYDVAGKTGTSHKVSRGGYSNSSYNSSYIGFTPVEHPKLLIAVHINEPKGSFFNHSGAISAAPVFAKIAHPVLRILGVPPTESNIDATVFKNLKQRLEALQKGVN